MNDTEPRTRIMACSKTRDHVEHAPHEWTSARDETLTWQCYGYIAPGQSTATRTTELARFFSDRPAEAAAPAPTRKGGEIETVWCEAHGPAAHFLRDDCKYPHLTDQVTRARLNDPIRAFEQLVAHLGAKYPEDRPFWAPHLEALERVLRGHS